MNHKQRMLNAITGKATDLIPWAPRLDLWYLANKRTGTLPKQFQKASLMEITDSLGFAFHAVIPNFQQIRSANDSIDRALGIYNLQSMPYKTILENIERKVTINGDRTIVEYRTPVGNIRTVTLYDEMMRKAGITITHIEEHAIKSVNDYKALAYIFENAGVEQNYSGYQQWSDIIGDRGIAVAFLSLAASPMHLIMRELTPADSFFYQINDHPDEIAALAASIEKYWDKVLTVCAACPADVFLLGANYDAMITYPPFFAQHIKPTLKKFAQLLHKNNKFLLTHTDGENTGLLEHYLDADIDIADSICPSPMTRMTFRQTRDVFAGKITIMGGIPSIALTEDSMDEYQFDKFLDNFFEDITSGDHLILGISDTTPPGAKFERLLKISRRITDFGPVPKR